LRGAAQSIIDGAMFSDVASPAIDELVEDFLRDKALLNSPMMLMKNAGMF